MRDYLFIGPTPADEACEQVGMPSYNPARARKECALFIQQLRRAFGNEPDGARLAIKAQSHDFGTYNEVVCHFDDSLPESLDYAFRCEGEAPEKWDDEARAALADYDSQRADSGLSEREETMARRLGL